jgi:NAD(P)-dependent dehydrogenase (short-subunit alcohol dehydrogenase family)
MSEVTVVIGAGQIGQAIARRVSAGKQVLLADLHQTNADAAAEVLADAGFDVGTATVDVAYPQLYDTFVVPAASRKGAEPALPADRTGGGNRTRDLLPSERALAGRGLRVPESRL